MKNIVISTLSALLLLGACKTGSQKNTTTQSGKDSKSSNAPQTTVNHTATAPEPHRLRYNPSATRINDIIHMKLEVQFDYKKARMNGKVTLDVRPYFYPTATLTLDAKNFDFHKVQIKTKTGNQDLQYKYDGEKINIQLDREYKKSDTYQVYMEYTAKPNERTLGGSSAISSDKGLYFINPDSSETGKHVEIWTQGETEANSCWFPTNDKPNEKITHELLITVRDEFETLSNGLLISSKKNSDGTRTDHWKMSKPHAPYLVMMAIGDYAIVIDKWKKSNGQEMEVAYFVEKEYEQYARDIFGKTPKMLEYFSKRLGVEYPWEKYAQVVVRDYVSGAMENTTATIHGDFLYRTKRELLDDHNESIIAHELFHHWFGDLVTCESWANLPLNESFANYSQFLWDEYEHGADVADHYAYIEMNGYLLSTKQSGYADMVRFDYVDKEEMFDAHSYNKGGRILHMLRNIIGDEAFFESTRVYLTENQYQPAEMHHLRLAFEKVTGEDLNWFFNQWFFAKGHPLLKFTQQYDENKGRLAVMIEQKQNFEEIPLYILPMDIDVYTSAGKFTHSVKAQNRIDTFYFDVKEKPLLVNIDSKKILLCEKDDIKPLEQWIYQYHNAPKYLDRREAIEECAKSNSEEAHKVIVAALNDSSSFLRELAMKNLKKAIKTQKETIRTKLSEMAAGDKNTNVRASAIRQLARNFSEDLSFSPVYEKAVNDSSYNVVSAGLQGIAATDSKRAMILAKAFEKEKNSDVKMTVAEIYAEHGTEKEHSYFIENLKVISGFQRYEFIAIYGNYLRRQNDAEIEKGLALFEEIARTGSPWWMKFSGYQQLSSFQSYYSKRELELSTQAESLRKEGKEMEANQAQSESVKAKNRSEQIANTINDLKAKETDKNILQYVK